MGRKVFVLVVFVLSCVPAFLFWRALGAPVDMPDVAGGRFSCVSYTPYAPGGSPLDKDYAVDPDIIRADLMALRPLTDCLRTYSSLGPQGDVVRIAADLGMHVQQGIWISGDAENDAKEIEGGLALAREHPATVRALIVGNEVLLRREMAGDRLAGIIRSVKAETSVPVTYADIFEFWRRSPVVAEAVDFLSLHILPHWDDPRPVSIDAVQDHVAAIVARARETFPGKAMAIGEIGWPSAGRTRGAAVPSRVNEARFLREFSTNAGRLGLPYNIIEGKDQPWKRGPEGTVGGYWGILDEALMAKFPLTGPVAEWPNWRWAFAASMVGAAALFTFGVGRARERSLSPMRAAGLAGFCVAVGSLAVLSIEHIRVTSLFAPMWAANLFTLLVAVALSLLAVMAVAGAGAGLTVRRAAPLAEIAAWARGGFSGDFDAPRLSGLLAGWVLLALTVENLWLAFDGRHRDLPVALCLWLGLTLWARPSSVPARGAEEKWLALTVVACAPFTLDGPDNVEAMAWAVVSA
ncbi:MAG: glycoside hydrolase family 17, partial [Alphaproteobacteria bacterium]|nr:glycoside hydrolase family 17 [Alphaproteobacteria bacterium]